MKKLVLFLLTFSFLNAVMAQERNFWSLYNNAGTLEVPALYISREVLLRFKYSYGSITFTAHY